VDFEVEDGAGRAAVVVRAAGAHWDGGGRAGAVFRVECAHGDAVVCGGLEVVADLLWLDDGCRGLGGLGDLCVWGLVGE